MWVVGKGLKIKVSKKKNISDKTIKQKLMFKIYEIFQNIHKFLPTFILIDMIMRHIIVLNQGINDYKIHMLSLSKKNEKIN